MKNFLEAHSGISCLLVDKSKYDGVWISSLTHATAKGLPDNELVPLKERVDLVEEFKRITNKPIIVDIDNGGELVHLSYVIKWFSKAGAYAVIMEDKKGEKQNSLLEVNTQQLEDVDRFCEKIKIAKKNAGEMKIYARIESLIAKHSMYDALIRSEAYINAGADGILIHSKQQVEATEVMMFATEFRKKYVSKTLIAVPTTYKLPEKHPFDIVINANHLLRASLKAMQKYIAGEPVELASVQEIFDLVGK